MEGSSVEILEVYEQLGVFKCIFLRGKFYICYNVFTIYIKFI